MRVASSTEEGQVVRGRKREENEKEREDTGGNGFADLGGNGFP